MKFQTLGIIRSPYDTLENMPIQPKGARDVIGSIEMNPELVEGLKDLEGFSHVFLLYAFHHATREKLSVVPFMDTEERGVFATRSPLRPNHIGLSIVEITSIKNNIIYIKGVDILDGTPLLDIKPYIEAFDAVKESRSGWMTKSDEEVETKRSDNRFL